jgi:membrane protein involved in colicin uptake
LSILVRITSGAVIAGVGGGEEESVMAVIAGVMIAGSAIPTWYRTKIARMKAGRGARDLEYRLEDRMAEFEQRQQDQMERLARMQTEHMADLEERIDFAERLLAKREQIEPG